MVSQQGSEYRTSASARSARYRDPSGKTRSRTFDEWDELTSFSPRSKPPARGDYIEPESLACDARGGRNRRPGTQGDIKSSTCAPMTEASAAPAQQGDAATSAITRCATRPKWRSQMITKYEDVHAVTQQ
jgi:hypothetical protein